MAHADRLVLVDGNALLHRAFHAVGPLTTTTGELVNATFGFTSMLLKGLQDIQPAYVAVAFDMSGPTFRHETTETYKAQRPHMAPELVPQFERVRQVVQALGIPIYETPRFEADDVLGTLAVQATLEGLFTTIVTSDRDSLQLVNDHVSMLMTRRGFQETTLYNPTTFREQYGFDPASLIDYKAIVGDTSDNILGVPGIGEKTGTLLIHDYGDVDGVYAHLDALKPKLATSLREHEDRVRKNRVLVTIRTDAPVQFRREASLLAGYDRDKAVALFRELEFRTLLSKLPIPSGEMPSPAVPLPHGESAAQTSMFAEEGAASREEPQPSSTPPTSVTIVRTEDDLRALLGEFASAPAIAFDVETTSADATQAKLVGISVSGRPGAGAYIPVGHREPGPGGQLQPELALALLEPLLRSSDVRKVAHNAKYDVMVLRRYGLDVWPVAFDTMVAAYLLNPGARGIGLKDLAFGRLGIEMTNISALIGTGAKTISMSEVAVHDAAPYAAADADMTLRLAGLLEPELGEKGLTALFTDVEMPLISVLADMELAGIRVDSGFLAEMSGELGQKIRQLELAIYDMTGHAFNINSGQQLGKVLFEELKLQAQGKTRGGAYATGVDVLETLIGKHPVIDAILEYRQLIKLRSTYVDGIPQLINPKTGKVHTSFNQTQAATGRLSSSDPNLQNIPIRTELGRRIRGAFVPSNTGWSLLAADYSQIELRILAHITQDPLLVKTFAAREDIHRATAAAVFGVAAEDVTAEQRRIAKVVNFGIIYGMGEYGLARDTGLPREEAGKFIKQYLGRYPGVRDYITRTKLEAATLGYVETLLHRKRYLPELRSPMRELRAAAERAAINMPIQGTNADIIKLAMIRLHDDIPAAGLHARMLLQVHDELVFEAPDEEIVPLAALVRERMIHALPLSVEIDVEVNVGKSWAEMAPIAELVVPG
jgi:DNA polymerase-1